MDTTRNVFVGSYFRLVETILGLSLSTQLMIDVFCAMLDCRLVYAKLKIIARLTLGLFKSLSPRIDVLHAQR